MSTLLQETDGLSEAITQVVSEHAWVTAVQTAHPDLEDIMAEDETFAKKVVARRAKVGESWHTPAVAVSVIEQLKSERVRGMSDADFLKVRQKVLGYE